MHWKSCELKEKAENLEGTKYRQMSPWKSANKMAANTVKIRIVILEDAASPPPSLFPSFPFLQGSSILNFMRSYCPWCHGPDMKLGIWETFLPWENYESVLEITASSTSPLGWKLWRIIADDRNIRHTCCALFFSSYPVFVSVSSILHLPSVYGYPCSGRYFFPIQILDCFRVMVWKMQKCQT